MCDSEPPPPPRPPYRYTSKQTARKSTGFEAERLLLISKRFKMSGLKYSSHQKKPTYKAPVLKRTYETRSGRQVARCEGLEKTAEPRIVVPGDKKKDSKKVKEESKQDKKEEEREDQ